MRLVSLVTTVCLTFAAALAPAADVTVDVAVYGGTSGGVVAALQAARMGKKVVLIEPGRHLGGMTSGGLSAVDIGDPRTIGGITREFFTRLVARYGKKLAWDEPHKAVGGSGGGTGGAYAIEPHVAEEVFGELVKEAGVPGGKKVPATKSGQSGRLGCVFSPDLVAGTFFSMRGWFAKSSSRELGCFRGDSPAGQFGRMA